MAFTSHIFLFYFLPVLLLLYYALPGRFLAARNVLLLAASYVFYAWVNPWFAALLFGLTVVNYIVSRGIAGTEVERTRLALMACGVTLDLAVLGFFKYAGFFEQILNGLVGIVGGDALPVLKIVLPVGISFYTFKIISYLVDTYRDSSWRGRPALALSSDIQGRDALATEEQPPFTWRSQARSLLDFACYVSFFPQLLSGPIQRYGTIDSKSEPVPTFADQLVARGTHAGQVLLGRGLVHAGLRQEDPAGERHGAGGGRGLCRRSRPARWMPGSARWPTPSSCTSISPPTPRWPSASG